MTTSTHTPGPWSIKHLMGRDVVAARHACTIGLPNATGDIIIANPAPYGAEHAAERQSTVKLIAAAPDLLAALEEIEAQLADHPDASKGNAKVHFCLMQARGAIAKAKGGAA